jgi:hypothetical protein
MSQVYFTVLLASNLNAIINSIANAGDFSIGTMGSALA